MSGVKSEAAAGYGPSAALTAQQAFDTGLQRLRDQGEAGWDGSLRECVYINGSGHRCAVGIMLPSELAGYAQYDIGDGGCSAGVLLEACSAAGTERAKAVVAALSLDGLTPEETAAFWDRLQDMHDNAAAISPAGVLFREALEDFAALFARTYGFEYRPPAGGES